MKLQYKKYMIFLLGIAILTLGVSMTVKSDIGAGSYDSINFAIADILNTKVSLAISMTAFLVLIITAYIRKGFIRITTFITSVIMGLFTDVWVKVVDLIPVDTILNKLILFISIIKIRFSYTPCQKNAFKHKKITILNDYINHLIW